LNIKEKGKHATGRPRKDGKNRLGKLSHKRNKEYGKKKLRKKGLVPKPTKRGNS
jgi:hypothetical protein